MNLIRSQLLKQQSVRLFHSTSLNYKKPPPFKRLTVAKKIGSRPTSKPTKLKPTTPPPKKQRIQSKDDNNNKPKYDNSNKLPILETFTKEELSKGENLVQKITKFSELKLSPPVRETVLKLISKQTVLRAQNFENKQNPKLQDIEEGEEESILDINPTKIQVVAIHEISKRLNEPNLQAYTIAAETGSGKTWAYLAPLLDFLKQEELKNGEDWTNRLQHKASIRSVILVPTHELVDQVYNNLNGVKELLDLNVFKWDFQTNYTDLLNSYKSRIDILVTTPGKINTLKSIRMISRPEQILSNVKFLVVDEADTLMDRSFVELTYDVMKTTYNVTRLIFCSATISNQFQSSLSKIFPLYSNPKLLISPTLHKFSQNLKFHLLDSTNQPYQGSKLKVLAQVLYAISKDGTEQKFEKRCVVFVNNKEDAIKLSEKLQKGYNHDVVSLTGNDTPGERSSKISLFVNPPRLLSNTNNSKDEKKQYKTIQNSNIQILQNPTEQTEESKVKVLITTDIAARGLNFYGVRNVILYDNPNTSIDFLHRIGRTGRMNSNGRVFIITDKSTKPWLKNAVKNPKKFKSL